MSNFTERAKQKAEAMAKKALKERQADLLKRRMEYAKEGTIYYKANKFREATEKYLKYLSILEDWKGVSPGTLHPSHFDPKKDAGEMILMAGIFWDLAKLYDRSSKKVKGQDPLKNYLDLYVLFSKGMPYQSLCAETIRKYLMNDKPVHRGPFKDAYTALGGGKCFIVSSVGEFTADATLPVLRGFRDDVLTKSFAGRFAIRIYYFIGPIMARIIRILPMGVQKFIARLFDKTAKYIWS